ncbi:hypothetical protein T492DRAFT_57357 [Pavlovales sp. CCMP2436]|nr:hypothetical protein T492DRAFT_57357 [Pavlovales sp. CCMP2436]
MDLGLGLGSHCQRPGDIISTIPRLRTPAYVCSSMRPARVRAASGQSTARSHNCACSMVIFFWSSVRKGLRIGAARLSAFPTPPSDLLDLVLELVHVHGLDLPLEARHLVRVRSCGRVRAGGCCLLGVPLLGDTWDRRLGARRNRGGKFAVGSAEVEWGHRHARLGSLGHGTGGHDDIERASRRLLHPKACVFRHVSAVYA